MLDVTTVNRDLTLLYPPFAKRVLLALDSLWKKNSSECITVFEGYRTPERQGFLYEQGRTRGGRIVTNSEPWHSWHQYGLAVDIALKDVIGWHWDFDPAEPAQHFLAAGLKWLYPFEVCHFQWMTHIEIKDVDPKYRLDYKKFWETL